MKKLLLLTALLAALSGCGGQKNYHAGVTQVYYFRAGEICNSKTSYVERSMKRQQVKTAPLDCPAAIEEKEIRYKGFIEKQRELCK